MRVLCGPKGEPLTQKAVQVVMKRVAQRYLHLSRGQPLMRFGSSTSPDSSGAEETLWRRGTGKLLTPSSPVG